MTGIQLHLLQALGWAVLNSLWQMALLWVIYQVVTAFLKNTKASYKSVLATSLLFAGSFWFIYTFLIVYSGISEGGTAGTLISSGHEVHNWLLQSLPFISGAYLLLLVLPVLRFIRNYRYVQVIRKYGLSKINVNWRIFVRNVAARMGIKKTVQIWVSEFVTSPVTIGFFKPVILVPLAAINHLTPPQLEAVLLHELAHIRRYDYLINLLINFIQTILYFNPFVKAFVKIVEREREKSCDEMVLQFQYDSHEYASALLTLEKTKHLQKILIVAATGNKNDITHRIETILGVQKKPAISANKIAGLVSAFICIIALNLLLLLPGTRTDKNNTVAYTDFPSPFNVVYDEAKDNGKESGNEINQPPVNNIAANSSEISTASAVSAAAVAKERAALINEQDIQDISSYAYKLAGFEEKDIPELKRYQEQQVKEALEASRKVLESTQWKVVEKSIADAFSEKEKQELKKVYEKELNKFDWNKWEVKLKQAYENIDWEKVNNQLSYAINQIRIDSLQRVYNDVAIKLNEIQKELNANQVTSIPDTDITLKAVEDRKRKVQQTLNTLKAVRNKKIVHL
ncbi:MAG TPA: M56 family metallopeptidase [Chitinophagaceae bacterium]|nr:M56 family metallopeptidase [Chitinophagaceae bacterium]